MAKLRTLFRRASPEALQAYFQHRGVKLPADFDWTTTESARFKQLLEIVEEMNVTERARLEADAEQIVPMAEEAGQTALGNVVTDTPAYQNIESAHDRALFVFLNDLQAFRQAEDIRYLDEKRRGRMWTGFVLVPDLLIKRDPETLEVFQQTLRNHFKLDKVHVELFDRVRRTFDGGEHPMIQITIYREGALTDDLAFDGPDLVRRPRRPVLEAAITFEPGTGVVEVVARDKEIREALVRHTSRDLLGIDFKNSKLPLKRYDLTVLMKPHAFAVDAADGIDYVKVRALRLMPIDDSSERVTLECTDQSDRTIWDMAELRFGNTNPLRSGFVCTKATLAIKFHPKADARRGRTMQLDVTMPHGCNLKERTSNEQMIGEKYLRRWGLLEEE
jgi:hypothetical protein